MKLDPKIHLFCSCAPPCSWALFRLRELRHFCTFSGPAWPMGTPPADSASWGGGMRRGARSCARALGVGSCACNPWRVFGACSQRHASQIAPSREHQRSQRGRIDTNRPCPGLRQAAGARGTPRRPRSPNRPKYRTDTLTHASSKVVIFVKSARKPF